MIAGADPRALIPYLVIGVIMLLRWRNISRARPLRPAMLVVVPGIVAVVTALVLWRLPVLHWGWAVFALGLVVGAGAGWQRTRLMHLERDAETDRIMVRNSPAAFLFVLAVLAARKLFAWETGLNEGHSSAAHSSAAMLALYASLGFALGLVTASRIELWRRAKGLD
ncbi:DUF1453 family protein [Novosphingobium flavum]|uniref:DUF1453 family protein n=1 Tax=Novosphingobium flavum TaxID=1778672 RepID=A0A7X1FQD7_9SPHN|nr:CcdC protein domain-containing protein [Novosphingobium flavum]MBC2664998.1 DUF1453 family protein [Novosphingobium flavum]